MSWKNIRLILIREVRDQLRDRRTLFMIAILPLLLYPALGIGMVQMTLLFTAQPRSVVILGAKHLPLQPPLLDGNHIAANWFEPFGDVASTLNVITDETPGNSVDSARNQRSEELLKQAERFLGPVGERRRIKELIARAERAKKDATKAKRQAEGAKSPAQESGNAINVDERDGRIAKLESEIRVLDDEISRRNDEVVPLDAKIGELFGDSRFQVLIVVPDGFAKTLQRVNAQLKSRTLGAGGDDYFFGPTLVVNRADEKSLIAYNRVREALRNWEKQILEERLSSADLPQTVAMPLNPDTLDVAQDDEIAANLWSKLFPALLVIMAVTGAFYPAVDLAAGEKERGTMETLLICPATRGEIVMGKFLTVMLFSLSTALLNLTSMGFTGKYMASMANVGTFAKIGDLSLPSPMDMLWVVVLLIPLAALFSAMCLALATFARSSKEGQYYLTPLLMVTMGLTIFCLSPGVGINSFYSVMPVVGPALLLKELLASPGSTEPLVYAIPVLITSIGYSLLALWWAIEQFSREDVLFREAERFELRLWIRHLLRDKEPTPSFAEAGYCFIFIIFLQFGAMKFMQDAIHNTPDSKQSALLMQLLMIQQLVIIATPALFMGVMLTTSVVRTFRLRLPSWRMLALAGALPVFLHPLSLELSVLLQKSFFPPLPSEISAQLQIMADLNQPLWFILLAFAATPAVCEEIAFRGFILSGFRQSRRVWLAIGLSSLTFGIMHMFPQQVFNATLLGLVLGLIAIRGNSLIPCILFHLVYNSLGVIHGRLSRGDFSWIGETWGSSYLFVEDGAIRYTSTTLFIAATITVVLLRWLVRRPNAESISRSNALNAAPPERLPDPSVTDDPRVRIG